MVVLTKWPGICGFHFPVQMAYSFQFSYPLTDCSISRIFGLGLTTNIMKNFQQQEHFHGTNKHFLPGGGWKDPALSGAFPLPSFPSQL